MTTTASDIAEVIDEIRNGVNGFYRHWAVRRFIYSDGVHDLASTANCFWLLDIIATEIVPLFLKNDEPLMTVRVVADARTARITGHFSDESTDYARSLEFADLPDCSFSLCLGWGGNNEASLILWSEY